MRRKIAGLHAGGSDSEALEGLFLVEVERAFYTPRSEKPYFTFRFSIIEPANATGRSFGARLYSSDRALWKLCWFLKDFGYDNELFAKDEIDDRKLIGLRGVVKISTKAVSGRSFINLDAFAPADTWSGSELGRESALSA